MKKILLILFAAFICAADEFPDRLPQVKADYRPNDIIKYDDANKLARTVNSLCAKLGINNSQAYGVRYTNTIDYKVYLLGIKVYSNTLDIATLFATTNYGGGGSVSNIVDGWMYIVPPSIGVSNKNSGLRMLLSPEEYANSNAVFELYSLIDSIEELSPGEYVTNFLTSTEFVDKYSFYGYKTGEEKTRNRDRENLILMLVSGLKGGAYSNVLGNTGYPREWFLESGGAYFSKPLIIDDGFFADSSNNYYTLLERSKFYNPLAIRPNQTNDIIALYNNLLPSNQYGSFLMFKPLPRGYNNITPLGYEFVDADELPVFTIRGLQQPYSGLTNAYGELDLQNIQYWSIEFHQKKVTGIPEPLETETEDAVPLDFLNKEFDRKMIMIHVDTFAMPTNYQYQYNYSLYKLYSDLTYFNQRERVFWNPVDTTGGQNLNRLFSTSVNNNKDYILLSYDAPYTNDFMMPAGVIVDPYNVVPNLYGSYARNHFGGFAVITPGNTNIIINLTVLNSRYTNVISSVNDVITVVPVDSPSTLFNYWVSYISNNCFAINIDAPQIDEMRFNWMVPKMLKESYHTVYYPRDRIEYPTTTSQFSVVRAGTRISTNIFNVPVVWSNYYDYTVIFTPVTPNNILYSWCQSRNYLNLSGNVATVVTDVAVTNNLMFNWVRIRKQ